MRLDPTTQKRRVTYLLMPAIVAAVLVVGAFLYRASRQIEQVRKLSVIEATLSLANEKADRLDRLIIEQDNAVSSLVDVAAPQDVAQRWLPTAARETPTVRAVLVIDLSSRDGQVLGFASRSPGPEDEAFRRLVVRRLRADLELGRAPPEELRHLHRTYGSQSYLVSYWQRALAGRRYLVLAWHDVPRLVHDVFPRLFADHGGKARVAVADEEGRPVYGSSVRAGELTVGRPFPTTLYGWRISVTLTSADELGERIERRRTLELVLVAIACCVIIAGVGFVLVAVEQERRLSAQKSEFVANVSHELKTPLSLVRMFAELLLSGRVASDDKRRQYLEIMLAESERLTALIENVLDFARVDRGKATFDFVPADLGEVVQRAVDVYRYRAEREGLEIEVALAPDLPAVRLDPRAVELCLINLLDNAIKYAKDGGRVTVRTARDGAQAALSVEDRGAGIAPEDQRRIFDRFVRGRSARDARIRGTGIGLSLVKHIAEAHGGAVRVQSAPGEGARFTVTLPLWRGPLPAPPDAPPG
ncbi:MAG: HAMP domain-containing histidine kinase [Polyangiaceae bacterium]|nr:HAMP domain-containing histidine kinase [Polyangiaceae bacterium]